MQKKVYTVLSLFVAFLVSAGVTPAYAQTVPSFPSCVNPQGAVKVSYSSGTHGIVGNTSTYTGSDTVYQLTSNETLMQCFCPDSGSNGIQSNWWKASSLTQSEIDNMKNQGWAFVPNGALWGLDAVAYLVKNSDYTCKGESKSIVSVLGLAATGNITLIYTLLMGGLTSIGLGVLLRKPS